MASVGDNITSKRGSWKFDKQVADSFDSHIQKSIPFYDEIQGMVCELSDWFVHYGSVVYDLGCSTGTTINNLFKYHERKQLRCIGIDNSKEMIERAKAKVESKTPTIQIPNVDFRCLNLEIGVGIDNADLVISLFTLHFLRKERRREIIGRIFNGLNDGGGFIFVDKIVEDGGQTNTIFTELYHDFKSRAGFSDDEIRAKDLSLRGILQPFSLDRNLSLLDSFSEVGIFFKWYNWLGVVAIK